MVMTRRMVEWTGCTEEWLILKCSCSRESQVMSIAIVFSFLHTSPMLHVKMCTFHFLFGLKKPHQLPFQSPAPNSTFNPSFWLQWLDIGSTGSGLHGSHTEDGVPLMSWASLARICWSRWGLRITRAWTSGIFGEYAGDNGGWLIDHFSAPFQLVNPHEGKRQDASHPEGWHSPATCPSPVLAYWGSGRRPYCFISLWWPQPPMPSRGMWSHKWMVLGWILVSTPWFSHWRWSPIT